MEITDELREEYKALCDTAQTLLDRIATIEEDLEDARTTLASSMPQPEEDESAYTQRVNRRRNMVNAHTFHLKKLRRLQRTMRDREYSLPDELAAIAAIENVDDIGIANGCLYVSASVVYTMGATKYDFGDWVLTINPEKGTLDTNEIRKGYFKHGNPPVYRLGYETFCFGGNDSQVSELVESRLYFEAISVALSYIGTVNRGDEYLVPQHYHVVGSQTNEHRLLTAG